MIACWTARAANERYFQALKRKRISAKAADDLLRDLAAESLNSEEGVLPGNVEEAQTFLNLAVDEGAVLVFAAENGAETPTPTPTP